MIGVISLALALSGSFVQLALLSVVSRLCTYIGTACSVLVLRRRHGDHDGALQLPGGPLIPLAAIALSLGLLASAQRGQPGRRGGRAAGGRGGLPFRRKPGRCRHGAMALRGISISWRCRS